MSQSLDELLNEFVNRMIDAAGKNLESIVLFGSAAKTVKTEPVHDLNLLCTLKNSEASQLGRMAGVVEWWTLQRRQPSPMFFREEELAASADVFAIEFRDMQRSHRILFGGDPVATLKIPMNLHRVQVEHGLRSTILKLRQLYLRGCGNPKQLIAALVKSLSSSKTLLRHALLSVAQEMPDGESDLYSLTEKTFGAKVGAFQEVGMLAIDKDTSREEVDRVFDEYLKALEAIAASLDLKLPKREWGRKR